MTRWKYSDVQKMAIGPDKSLTVRILKVNQFSSELKRMSTVVEVIQTGANYSKGRRVVCKGAPEVIKELLAKVRFLNFYHILLA